jgi:hypothetical protein
MYSIKLITGENVPYNSKEEVLDIMRRVQQSRGTPNLITLKEAEGAGTIHVFPEFVIGYVEVNGTSLGDIMSLEEESHPSTMYDAMAEVAEINLYSQTYTDPV